MDIQILRITITVVAFVTFVAIVAWAWSGRHKARFEEAARLPFEGDDLPGNGAPTRGNRR